MGRRCRLMVVTSGTLRSLAKVTWSCPKAVRKGDHVFLLLGIYEEGGLRGRYV
jgi:hypothetical protein